MKRLTRRTILAAAPAALAFGSPLLAPWPARAAKQYGPGIKQIQMARFDGERRKLFGPVLTGGVNG